MILFPGAPIAMRIWVLYPSMEEGTAVGKVSKEGSQTESPL